MFKILYRFNKKEIFVIILFFSWSLFFAKYFIFQTNLIKVILQRYKYNEEEKFKMNDGLFYVFMKACQELIPENSDVFFDISPKEPLLYSSDWYLKEYYIQKAPYYLFPRRIFQKKGAKNKSINFRIVYNSKLKQFSLFHKNRLISHAAY